mgnify:CR=1 FL=1
MLLGLSSSSNATASIKNPRSFYKHVQAVTKSEDDRVMVSLYLSENIYVIHVGFTFL